MHPTENGYAIFVRGTPGSILTKVAIPRRAGLYTLSLSSPDASTETTQRRSVAFCSLVLLHWGGAILNTPAETVFILMIKHLGLI